MSKPSPLQTNKGVSALARKAGISITTASRKLGAGMSEADIIREADEYRDKQQRQTKNATTAGETKWEAECRKERALADLRELELATKRGEFVEAEKVNAWIAGMIIKARDVLLRMPAELQDRLAQESDPANVRQLLDEEIRRALNCLGAYKSSS